MEEQHAAPGLQSSLLGAPFEQKWNLLKATIEQLYVNDNLKLSDVIKIIKDRYGFIAV